MIGRSGTTGTSRRLAAALLALGLAAAGPAAAAKAKAAKKPAAKPEGSLPVDARTARAESVLSFGRFGPVAIYRRTPHPRNVVLFISGDGGWNLGVIDMAQALAGLDALVVGIDIVHYLHAAEAAKDSCTSAAVDFEALSQYVQKKLGMPDYVPPVLVGYSSGATLAYATLVQAPPSTFRGAISLGFCPDLPIKKNFCAGQGLAWGPGPKGKGVSFLPSAKLEAPFIALQGTADETCLPAETDRYVKQVRNGEIVLLPKVGHGFSVQARWMPQFKEAFQKMAKPAAPAAPTVAAPAATTAAHGAPVPAVSDLPLVEVPAKGTVPETVPAKGTVPGTVPAKGAAAGTAGDRLAVIVSGDGGWAGIDREVGGALAARGIPVVGLNSLSYFWRGRTPDETAKDLARILEHYLAVWGKQRAILVGYSMGADVLPFMVSRLPEPLRNRVDLVALLGPETKASFEFHVTQWLGGGSSTDRPVMPEVEKLGGRPRLLCLYGEKESDSICPGLSPALGRSIGFSGAHHFGGNYAALADRILAELPGRAAAGR
jgi:type IV secretory pathway VirJ component